MNYSRWKKLMESLGLPPSIDTFEALIKAYSERHRHYHNIQHVEALIEHFDRVANLAQFPSELELAIWFHDAVYQPRSSTNELDSANWAKRFLSGNGCDKAISNRVFKLIMATLHTVERVTNDEMLISDIDLTILGSPLSVYDQFEKNIRKEYWWVPLFLYKRERKKILKSFLNRSRVYNNDYFFNIFEDKAKENIKNKICLL